MKKQIRKRIVKAFLIVSVVSLVICIASAQFSMFTIRDLAITSNKQIGSQAAANSEEALTNQALSNSKALAVSKSDNINAQLQDVAKNLQMIADNLSYLYSNQNEYKAISVLHVKDAPKDTLAMQWALPQDVRVDDARDEIALLGNMKSIFDAVMKSNASVTTVYYTSKSGISLGYDTYAALKPDYFEGRTLTGYVKARDTGKLVISDTYQDSFGRGLNISMSIPCFDSSNAFVGVVGLDILIENLNNEILQTTVGESGYAMLLSETTKLISAPGLTSANETNLPYFLGTNTEIITQSMINSIKGVEKTEINGDKVYVIWSPISITNWNYVLVLPVSDIIAPANKAKADIESLTNMTVSDADKQIIAVNSLLVALLLVIIGFVVWVTMRISNKITKPISMLNTEIKAIGDGNLNYESTIQTEDEIEELSHTFEHMTKELKNYIVNLATVTADKERIATELNVATQIQASMLPCIFPAFPERKEMDIYATMQPAKEVGGDFYDFFLIDNSHLGLVIADVSGKGVPAALFMVIAKTLIKNHAQNGESPAQVFTDVNEQLCENNDAGMFVTAWMGILDIETGVLTYANAGHNAPVLRKGNSYEFLKQKSGFVLAGMEGIRYKQAELTLQKGDRLYLYTDGVTEATNKTDELFSDARLLHTLNQTDSMSLTELLNFVKYEIDVFVDGAEQFDDITMLALEYRKGGTCSVKELTVEAKTENLDTVLDFIANELETAACSVKVQGLIALAAEEIYTNIAQYAYETENGQAIIRIKADADAKRATIQFLDSGKPYNPLLKEDPDVTLSAEERDIGGLGIFITKKMMDTVEYDYKDGYNILTIQKAF